jgi:hypothetical protein
MVRVSTQVAMAELLLSGCTTSSDHLYIYPNGVRLDDSIEAAHADRHALSRRARQHERGQSQGGLPPDRVVEREDAILKDTQRLIELAPRCPARRHAAHGGGALLAVLRQPRADARRRLLARSLRRAPAHPPGRERPRHRLQPRKVQLHAGREYARTWAGWAPTSGTRTASSWTTKASSLFAATGTGVAHCPCSNMRLASASRPSAMLDAGVPVGLGVDGSASNDAAHMLNEARRPCCWRAWAAQPLDPSAATTGPAEMTARDALALATRGGAEVLGRTTSATWRWACAPIWRCSTCAHWVLQAARCTTRWAACCCAPARRRPTQWSTAAWWCAAFVFKLPPGKPPVDVMLTIIAVVAASATLQASGGLEVLLLGAEKLLRRNPKYVSILAPFVTCILTMLCGTGHVVYTMLPIIYDIAIKNNIRPERPMAAASVASQMGILASPVSVAVVSLVAFLAKAPVDGARDRLHRGAVHHHPRNPDRRAGHRHLQLVSRQGPRQG